MRRHVSSSIMRREPQRTWRDLLYQASGDQKCRRLPMNETLLSTLKTCKINHSPGEHVFLTHQGTPYRSHRSAFERALRHTFASQLAMAGVDLPTLQELMGHNDKMTLRYTHLSSGHQRCTVVVREGCGEKAPLIYTTGHPGQVTKSPQLIDDRELGR